MTLGGRVLRSLLLHACALTLGLTSAFAWASQVVTETSKSNDDASWLMPARNYASTRYSPLAQITPSTVVDLKVEFSFSTGIARGQESAPLVLNSTMYVVTPFPNYLYALDLTKPGAPVKWRFAPKPQAAAQGVACCDVINRGAVAGDGAIFYSTLDGVAVAVDATTGEERWRRRLADINKGETITAAPLLVKDHVFFGNAGGEFGVRGWVTALNVKDGTIAWKAFHTGSDEDVLIGPEFKPFYQAERGKNLGITSWPSDAWTRGGGAAWGWMSYDPDLNLLYYGTGNPGPWNAEQRPGDNKWTAGLFARNPDTGAASWFYQFSPHDVFDYDSINENLLLDLTIDGALRKVLVRPERNGYVYVIDRQTGQVLSADAFVPVNSTLGVDLKTGRPTYNGEKTPQVGKVIRDICPTAPGAKDWNPSSYSPLTGLIYIPHNNLCMDWESRQANYIAGTPYIGAEVRMHAGAGGNRGAVQAWDPVKRKAAWQIKEDLPVWSATLATGGGVVFYGTLDGWFKAVDAKTGDLKWSFQTGSGIIGQPISYRGPDGRQYIAVLSGVGGWAGAAVVGNLDPRDGTAAKGMVNATSDLKSKTQPGGTLYVFSLPKR